MPGFSSSDAIVNALTAGQTYKANWTKQFNPTTAAAVGEVHTLFRGGGNPGADAIFNAGTALTFQGVTDTTTSAGSIQHGGNVQPTYYKSLISASAVTSAATTVPGWLVLVDVVGFYRVTASTTITEQATTNTLGYGDTFTADAGTDVITWTSTTNIPSNILTGTRVQLTTTTTLPAGLSTSTNYYVIKVSDSTCKLATSYANAIAGTAINITDAGTGTHTMSRLLPRYTNGAGVQAIFFANNATPLGAGTPGLSLNYTNSAQTASRATPTSPSLPIGKTAASNSLVLYSGASGAGKFNYTMPLQAGDSGIAEIAGIRHNATYTSGEYSVAMIKELTRIPLNVLGQAAERNLQFDYPSLPRIYDGAALYWMYMSSTTTPANATFSGDLTTIWN
jgi:hypothetical protein